MEIKKAIKWRRLGGLPWCVQLGSADIGEAILDNGESVITTWGRNLGPIEIEHARIHLTNDIVSGGSGMCEFILPPSPQTDAILQAIDRSNPGGWNVC